MFHGDLQIAQIHEAASILIAFGIGLFFFSFNKIILNVFYALHETKIPTIISIIATVVNILLNFVLMATLQGTGLALATTICGILQTILFLYYLRKKFGFHAYLPQFFHFVARYAAQLVLLADCFYPPIQQ